MPGVIDLTEIGFFWGYKAATLLYCNETARCCVRKPLGFGDFHDVFMLPEGNVEYHLKLVMLTFF